MSGLSSQERELAEFLVTVLNLEVPIEEIDADAPLFNKGLGLDSIDALQLSVALSERYGIKLSADDSETDVALSSLRRLSDYIERKKNHG